MSSHPKKKAKWVKISNPREAGRTHVSLERARRFVRRGIARFDAAGRLEFLYDPAVMDRKLRGLPLNEVSVFCGCDAFPDRAVLPPSAEVMARQLSYA